MVHISHIERFLREHRNRDRHIEDKIQALMTARSNDGWLAPDDVTFLFGTVEAEELRYLVATDNEYICLSFAALERPTYSSSQTGMHSAKHRTAHS